MAIKSAPTPAMNSPEALDPRELLRALRAVKGGDFSARLPLDCTGMWGEISLAFNDMAALNESMARELARVRTAVGQEGRIAERAFIGAVDGSWTTCMNSINTLIEDMVQPTTEVARVIGAVARGDLSQTMEVDLDGRPLRGEFLRSARMVNAMVDQLRSFASEVTRVAREVGTEGKLGGQAEVQGVAGTWKDLTDNVNLLVSNLTGQMRDIAKVATAVANGDLSQKIAGDVRGEILELKQTVNKMVDNLNTFSGEVTRVAREVGVEGKLGGQARVPGAAGTWRDLTDNTNQLAANLTSQVRAISEVATAVTKGDLTRAITVEAQGEVADVKDNINQMIANLRETTRKNTEQDWLKTNLARFTRTLQGQRDLETVSRVILSELAPLVSAQHGVFYVVDNDDPLVLKLLGSFAYQDRKHLSNRFRFGEGLVGQAALEKTSFLVTDAPPDYIKIGSGLGEASPVNIIVLPVLYEGQVKAVIELASFSRFSDIHRALFQQLTESIGIVLNTIEATMRTEGLLKQSQSLTDELQNRQSELTGTNQRLEQQAQSLQASEERLKQQQEELQTSNEALEEKARLLLVQNQEVELKNREIEQSRQALEEKAGQLALTSKYKTEFLANMSHELRTPLNSLLILSKLLAENVAQNLTSKQVEFANTIHSSGTDLLVLINDILDLAKIESGTMPIDLTSVSLQDLRESLALGFGQLAQDRSIAFGVELEDNLPATMTTDGKRLQQVLRNLLSNAFKFTEQGRVDLKISVARAGWSLDHPMLDPSTTVLAFSVVDTGIGIPADKHRVIFEAFQQADGTTSRRYGGTGLGLSISREIAHLLGGGITLQSVPGEGSTFTLYLPLIYRESRLIPEPDVELDRFTDLRQLQWQEPALLVPDEVPDDRAQIRPGDQVLLIIEDDPTFARILRDLGRQKGFLGLVALRGEVGLALARRFRPDAISLDLRLPDVEGWKVLERLKNDPETSHIPVHTISADSDWHRALNHGAIGHLEKPVGAEAVTGALSQIKDFVDGRVKNLLVVEDNEAERLAIVDLIGTAGVRTTAVATGREALEALRTGVFDCVVLDLGLPDIPGLALIAQIKSELRMFRLPIVVYTASEVSPQEERELKGMADTIILKDVHSSERLLEETSTFLHRLPPHLPVPLASPPDGSLVGRKIFIVDDDIRNAYAVTSLLERHGMDVAYAVNGRDAIKMLEGGALFDAVLMDIMMPEMDGYETMRTIRAMDRFKTLPIIAVTAKAMKADRERCLDAGASDYVSKPVDERLLMSLLQVWTARPA